MLVFNVNYVFNCNHSFTNFLVLEEVTLSCANICGGNLKLEAPVNGHDVSSRHLCMHFDHVPF